MVTPAGPANGLNVSRFIRDQIALLYSEPAASQNTNRDRIVPATRDSLAQHRETGADTGYRL